MDFLEELFDLGKRKYKKRGDAFHNEDHHNDDHDDDHDDNHDRHHQYPTNTYPQVLANHMQASSNPAGLPSGIVCRRCSTQTVQGAKFCHGCGTAIEMILNCASCGSKLPVDAPFCSQCGYRNG
jgi:ribosomal protein L40E